MALGIETKICENCGEMFRYQILLPNEEDRPEPFRIDKLLVGVVYVALDEDDPIIFCPNCGCPEPLAWPTNDETQDEVSKPTLHLPGDGDNLIRLERKGTRHER